MIKIFLCLSLSFLICDPLFSAEDNGFDHLTHPKCETCIRQGDSTIDQDGYVQMGSYAYVQPEFTDAVLKSPSEILEICAGQGQVLESILKKRNEASRALCVKYTVVENSETNMKKIQEIYKANSKSGDWFGSAQKDLVEFLETNLEKKRNKYSHVFGGFALHIFGAQSFVAIVNGLFDVLQEGGYLYITQHSFHGEGYDPEYIENIKSGKLLPFWVNNKFWSDPVTMGNLLNAFGFQVIKSGLHQEKYPMQGNTVKYLGIVAQKCKTLYNHEMVNKYRGAADLFYAELDCSQDVGGCKARLAPGSRESSYIWSIYDPKVGQAYDALKVYGRNISNNVLLIEKFEIHQSNTSLVRALNTFLFHAVHDQHTYETILARVRDNDIVSRVLQLKFNFKKDETYQGVEDLQGVIQLMAAASGVKENLV